MNGRFHVPGLLILSSQETKHFGVCVQIALYVSSLGCNKLLRVSKSSAVGSKHCERGQHKTCEQNHNQQSGVLSRSVDYSLPSLSISLIGGCLLSTSPSLMHGPASNTV